MATTISRSIRRKVQRRANGRCEYCLLDEEDSFLPHEPDHIISAKHGGAATLENLGWACFLCNRRKGSDIASIDSETGQITRLFNPRTDRWSDHFALRGGLIEPLTPEGRATAFLLQFNHDPLIEMRERLQASGRYPLHV